MRFNRNAMYNARNRDFSRTLRKNMTPEEKSLWYCCLKKMPITFKRQKPIGDYIVDFYSFEAKLVIEIDGSQHTTGEGREKDAIRDAYLQGLGLKVMRFKNIDVSGDFNSVCRSIVRCVEERADVQIDLYK